MTILSNLTIITVFTMNKFKRGALLAQSVAKQKTMLQNARLCLKVGMTKEAKLYLAQWTIERKAYKVALQLQSV